MSRKGNGKGDTRWFVPGGKRPIAYSTNADSYLIEALAAEGLTFREAAWTIRYSPEAKAVCEAYIDRGYGDTEMRDLGVGR